IDPKQQAQPLYWVRATVAENSEAVCEIINVYSQAGIASYASGDIDPNHFSQPLPAQQIHKPAKPQPGIGKIVQPIPSFGGRAKENASRFYRRVNEQLRHKGRAVNSWDFEHLVLQQFPEIALVRCLNHTSMDHVISPGQVSVLIFPQLNNNNTPALSPKTDQGQIARVKTYLEYVIDPSIQLVVRNPVYQFLKIELSVRLCAGYDPGHYLKLLNQGLIQAIAPWSESDTTLNPFAHPVSYFSLLEYINRQQYVEEVGQFDLYLLQSATAQKGKRMKQSFDPIQPQYPWMIISSVAQHALKALSEAQLQEVRAKQATTPTSSKPKKKKKKKKQTTRSTSTTLKVTPSLASTSSTKAKASELPKKIPRENALYIGNDLYDDPLGIIEKK
ncbi:MAG: hypothetical protein AAGD05_18590, partial [Bacteroidota bacterium]